MLSKILKNSDLKSWCLHLFSTPSNPLHLQGTKDGKSFSNLDQIDPRMQRLFEMAGVDLKSLNKEDEEKLKTWVDQNNKKIKGTG